MIIIRLWGGIGNQLFQYSFGEYIRNVMKHDVVYDTSSFGNSDKLRSFELSILNDNIPTIKSIRFSRYTGITNRFLRFIYSVNNKFVPENKFVLERVGTYDSKKRYYLQGYWQQSIYPDHFVNSGFFKPRAEIPEEIKSLYDSMTKADNTVALHIRRGDYFSSQNIQIFGVCDKNYYMDAITEMYKIVPGAKVFVFSDDIAWVKDNIALPMDSVIVNNYDINQYWYIYLMSVCSHNIISNSTFSWWGAYLNNHPGKIIISPKRWTLNSDKTLALSDWIKI